MTMFRPITLNNFTNKIISNILCLRLSFILAKVISLNQSGFVKTRSIFENISLIRVAILSLSLIWPRLMIWSLGHTFVWSLEKWVLVKYFDMVWRIMSNNLYYVISNGFRHGFFQYSRGLMQGDPLSPSLFISRAEMLPILLNMFNCHPNYHSFVMYPKGHQINNLSFVDDVIIFTSRNRESLKLIMQTLSTYKDVSGQLLNQNKRNFMVPSYALVSTIIKLKNVTSFNQNDCPMIYLGCPIYIGRQKIIYYS